MITGKQGYPEESLLSLYQELGDIFMPVTRITSDKTCQLVAFVVEDESLKKKS